MDFAYELQNTLSNLMPLEERIRDFTLEAARLAGDRFADFTDEYDVDFDAGIFVLQWEYGRRADNERYLSIPIELLNNPIEEARGELSKIINEAIEKGLLDA